MKAHRKTRRKRLSFENRLIVIATIATLLSGEDKETDLDAEWLHLTQDWMMVLGVPFGERWEMLNNDLQQVA